jgi:hypothetical protein
VVERGRAEAVLLCDTLVPWAQGKHIHFLSQFDVKKVREFRESWKLAPITANDPLKKPRGSSALR